LYAPFKNVRGELPVVGRITTIFIPIGTFKRRMFLRYEYLKVAEKTS
jgi:hypothetical protein